MKAKVDPDLCIGCGLCVTTCPEVYKMEDDKAIVYVTPVPGEFLEAAKDAVAQCPTEAIILE